MSDISDDEAEPGILVTAKARYTFEPHHHAVLTGKQDAALKPFYYVVSKPAQRAYLSTLLVLLTSITLVATAVTAYLFFYYSYIPTRGFSRPIYLQFDPDHYPHGTTSLSRELVSNQRYDVKAILHMPRTPSNTAAGNFMLDLQLLGPITPSVIPSVKAEVLAHERRPAILTYQSPTMEHVHRAAALPLYITGLRQESEALNVKMMESIEFERGWRNVPASARLELRSEGKLQVYDAQVVFTARLHGLRYVYSFSLD
jgi:seipin